jgi:WD40 repeat protein
MSTDASVIAVRTRKDLVIVHRNGRIVTVDSDSAEAGRHVAVSPDGRFVVSILSELKGTPIRVWDAQTGRQLHQEPGDRNVVLAFSSDGNWLYSHRYGHTIWRAESWQETAVFENNGIAISPSGGMVAVGEGIETVRLVHVGTQAELARLPVHEHDRVYPLLFGDDSSKLYAWGQQTGMLYVWDLRRLRDALADLGLDWNSPRPKPARPRVPITSVVFDPGDKGDPPPVGKK